MWIKSKPARKMEIHIKMWKKKKEKELLSTFFGKGTDKNCSKFLF